VIEKTLKQIQSGQTRQRIIGEATRIFARKGFYGASIAQLAQAAGITKGAIYHHFADKEALFLAVIEQVRSDWERGVAHDVMRTPDARSRLQVLFDNHTRLIGENEAMCLIMTSLVSEMAELSPTLAAAVKGLYDAFAVFITQIIKKGQAAGQLRSDIEARLVAAGAVEMLRSVCSPLHDRTGEDRKVRMAAMKQVFLDGLRV
jgi:AcrR family transcriptional regulator